MLLTRPSPFVGLRYAQAPSRTGPGAEKVSGFASIGLLETATMDPKVYFLNQLRQARAAVLRDAEAVDALIHVFERMGMFLTGGIGCLGDYEGKLGSLAGLTPLARKLSKELHIPFGKLYSSVREARNSACTREPTRAIWPVTR